MSMPWFVDNGAVLAPGAQLFCKVRRPRSSRGRSPAGSSADSSHVSPAEQARLLSQELSCFPNLTSLDLAAEGVPETFLTTLPEGLQHLWMRMPVNSWGLHHSRDPSIPVAARGLQRFRQLQTLCLLSHQVPSGVWPLSATLRHLEVGGAFKRPYLSNCRLSWQVERRMRSSTVLPDGLVERLGEFRELCVVWANLSDAITALPDSMVQLTNLKELNLWNNGQLRSLFPGLGQCRKLRRLLICFPSSLRASTLFLPASTTQLTSLSFLCLQANTVHAPVGMEALTSLTTLEDLCDNAHIADDAEDPLFQVPSLQRLFTCRLPCSMSMFSSLRELQKAEGIQRRALPQSMWALPSLQTLGIEEADIPESPDLFRVLSTLEELRLTRCRCESRPASLGELPHLKTVKVIRNDLLRSFPSGPWPSLQWLFLCHCSNRLFRSLPEALAEAPNLKQVNVAHCDGLSSFPSGSWPSLQILCLMACPGLTCLPNSVSRWPHLSLIDLVELSGLASLPTGPWPSL